MAVSASKDAEFYLKRGRLYADKGKRARAIAEYTKAIQLQPDDPMPYIFRAMVSREMGDLDSALADLNRSIELQSDDSDGVYEQSRAVPRKGRP